MAFSNKFTTLNIVNNMIREKTETDITEEKEQKENKIKKGKCSDYRSFKPNTIDIQSKNLGIIPDINSNKNINNCINAIQHDKPYNKTVENYRNIVEGFELPDMPDVNMPDVNMPDLNMPDLNMPDLNMPDVNNSDENNSDENNSDVNMPGVNMPDVNMPDLNMPDVNMPDLNMPDVNMPDLNMPDLNMPDLNIPDVDKGVTDGVKNILLLIVSGIISVFIFALFVFGPFVFWSMHAPNQMYSDKDNPCYNRFTILERFFPFKKNSVPYDWKTAKKENWCYPKKQKQASISIDTCMNNQISISETGKVYDIISYLESLLKGFPYNLIMPDRDRYYSKYVGGFLLFIALLISIYIFFMIFVFKGNFWRGDLGDTTMAVLIGMLLTAIVSSGITFLTIKYHMKDNDKEIDMPWKHLGVLISLPIIGNLIGGFESDGNNFGIISAIVCAILAFIIFSSISSGKFYKKSRNDEKDFSFVKFPVKILHFIRKCIVNGYIENIKCYRKTFYQGFDIISNFFNNHLPKSIFAILFVFFGSFIIPFTLLIIHFISFFRSMWCGLLGMFKTNMSKNNKEEDRLEKNRSKNTVKITAWVLTLLLINPVLNIIYTAFNGLLIFLTCIIVPFFYTDIIATIFKCNVKYLIIIFGLGLLSTLWYYQDKKNGIDFGLTNDILGWMTVTFIVLSFLTLRS